MLSTHILSDTDGKIIVSTDSSIPVGGQMTQDQKDSFSTKDYIVWNTALGTQRWELFSAYDMQPVKQTMQAVTWRVIMIGIVVLLLFLMMAVLISHTITRPLQELADYMGAQEKGLPEEIAPSPYEDEVGTLIESFNYMARRNKELFEYVQWERRTKQMLELALLQSQIKPHFLYNTLDTIYCLVLMDKPEDAGRVTKLLADYYRSILNRGEEWIWMEEELKSVTQYLEIQKVRYRDFVEYTIDLPSSMQKIQIPKMTLQPLVENALYHGIKPKKLDGKIAITGEREGPWAYLHVCDNGIGMSQEDFNHALQKDTPEQEGGFGLRNVERRLKLFYGERSHLRMERKAGITQVSICLYWGEDV